MEQLKDRLRYAMAQRNLTQTQLAKDSKVSQATIGFILNGRNKTTKSNILASLAGSLGVSVAWLAGASPDMSQSSEDKTFIIPYYDSENLIYNEELKEFSFSKISTKSKSYLNGFFLERGIEPENCKLFTVQTDTMEPMIFIGDSVLVNCADRNPWLHPKGHVYAFVTKEGVFRVHLLKPLFDEIEVSSINTSYKTKTYTREFFTENMQIVGRVIDKFGDGGL